MSVILIMFVARPDHRPGHGRSYQLLVLGPVCAAFVARWPPACRCWRGYIAVLHGERLAAAFGVAFFRCSCSEHCSAGNGGLGARPTAGVRPSRNCGVPCHAGRSCLACGCDLWRVSPVCGGPLLPGAGASRCSPRPVCPARLIRHRARGVHLPGAGAARLPASSRTAIPIERLRHHALQPRRVLGLIAGRCAGAGAGCCVPRTGAGGGGASGGADSRRCDGLRCAVALVPILSVGAGALAMGCLCCLRRTGPRLRITARRPVASRGAVVGDYSAECRVGPRPCHQPSATTDGGAERRC